MPEVSEERIAVEGFLDYDLLVPASDGPAPLLMALHGYGGNKSSMMKMARRMAPEGFAIAALQGSHQHIVRPEDASRPLGFGFGWVTNYRPEESIALHHRAIAEIIDRLSREGKVDPAQVFLLGFSQSVALNFRFAFSHPDSVAGIVAICGGIPGDWENEEKYRPSRTDVLVVGGEKDDFYPPERTRANAGKLERRARRLEVEILPCGHEITADAVTRVRRFLEERARTAR
jgi:phospholipase/carboxylesterase